VDEDLVSAGVEAGVVDPPWVADSVAVRGSARSTEVAASGSTGVPAASRRWSTVEACSGARGAAGAGAAGLPEEPFPSLAEPTPQSSSPGAGMDSGRVFAAPNQRSAASRAIPWSMSSSRTLLYERRASAAPRPSG